MEELSKKIILNMCLSYKNDFNSIKQLEKDVIYSKMKYIFDNDIKPIIEKQQLIIANLELKNIVLGNLNV